MVKYPRNRRTARPCACKSSIGGDHVVIRKAESADCEWLAAHDRHISEEMLRESIGHGRVLIAEDGGAFAGWLRYGMFWDSVPFMNMLYVIDSHQNLGVGTALVRHWESAMRAEGYRTVMTSTQSNEYAQHFYYNRGYRAIGSFALSGDVLEIVFEKQLAEQ